MPDAFATIWRPGDGTQWVRWGMSGDEFKAQDATYFAEGLRVSSLLIRDGKIAAVWRPGRARSGSVGACRRASSTRRTRRTSPGTARHVARDQGRQDRRRLAAGHRTQWIRWGMSGDEFKAQDTTYFPQGLRVTRWRSTNGKSARRCGVRARATQWMRWGMSGDDFVAQDRSTFAQGLRITVTGDRGTGEYAAVWQSGPGAQWWTRAGRGRLHDRGPRLLPPGLQDRCLDLQEDPVGAYRYPWKGGVSHTVGQGNNNPPPGLAQRQSRRGHSTSIFPAGTEIRAARERCRRVAPGEPEPRLQPQPRRGRDAGQHAVPAQ